MILIESINIVICIKFCKFDVKKKIMLSGFKSKYKISRRLFLICPSWCLESKLRKEFGAYSYFMTALAGMLSFDDSKIAQMKNLITNYNITKICFVAHPNCQYIKNIIHPVNFYDTKAEKLLVKIYHKKYDDIQQELRLEDKCLKLSIYRAELQLAYLKRHPQLLALIENRGIDLSVLVNHTAKKV